MGDEWACSCGFQYNAAASGVCVACDRKRVVDVPAVVATTVPASAAPTGALEPSRQAAVERALAAAGHGDSAPESAIGQIVHILFNIVREPDNARYRRLNLTNPRVVELTNSPGVAGVLEATGFRRTQQVPKHGLSNELVPYLELAPVQHDDASRCAAVARLLEDWLALRRRMQASMAASRSSAGSLSRTVPPIPVPVPVAPEIYVDLRKTVTGVGLNISEEGVVRSINTPEASAAGVQVGAQISSVNGISVTSRSMIVDELRTVSTDTMVSFGMRAPSLAGSRQAAAASRDDAESLALARRLQEEEDALRQDRAALLAGRQQEV